MSTISHIGLARSFDHAVKHLMDLLARFSQDDPARPSLILVGEDKNGQLSVIYDDCGDNSIGLVELAKVELAAQILSTQNQPS